MSVFAAKSFRNHEQIWFHQDLASGLAAIIAIHDTTLGPALGGCRYWSYDNEDAALDDVLRLSRGMTYKAALAGLSFGGGKAVILAPNCGEKSPALFQAFGRFVHSLAGRYITAEDVGTSPADMEIVHGITPYVAGVVAGGAGDGDPSPATAWGVFHGLRAAVAARLGRADLQNVHVAVQGLGHVGGHLAQYLSDRGALLTVADLDTDRLAWAKRDLGAKVVAVNAIYDVAADVFAPNAMGAVLNDATIPRLAAKVVAGSANNQLAEDRHGADLDRCPESHHPVGVVAHGNCDAVALFDAEIRDQCRRQGGHAAIMLGIAQAFVLIDQKRQLAMATHHLEHRRQGRRAVLPDAYASATDLHLAHLERRPRGRQRGGNFSDRTHTALLAEKPAQQ